MEITPVIPKNKKVITGYSEGLFIINNHRIAGNIIVYDELVLPWNSSNPCDITIDSLQMLLNTLPEILLIGCGTTHQSVPKKLKHHFAKKGVSIEMMTTGAACRTYNILLAEGRSVAAALLTL